MKNRIALIGTCGMIALALGLVVHAASPTTQPVDADTAGETASPNWLTDPDKATELAEDTERDLFVFFTGSDWCGWCEKLQAQVLTKPQFVEQTADQFVFLKLDFPMHTEQDPQVRKRNKQWAERYRVEGYPTVLLADADMNVYGRTGYRRGGPEAYLAHLEEVRSPANRRTAQLDKLVNEGEYEQAESLLSKLLADVPASGEKRQRLLFLRARIEHLSGRTGDAYATLANAHAAEPDSPMAEAMGRLLDMAMKQ